MWLISAYKMRVWFICSFITVNRYVTDQHVVLSISWPAASCIYTLPCQLWLYTKWTRRKFSLYFFKVFVSYFLTPFARGHLRKSIDFWGFTSQEHDIIMRDAGVESSGNFYYLEFFITCHLRKGRIRLSPITSTFFRIWGAYGPYIIWRKVDGLLKVFQRRVIRMPSY